MSNDMLNTGVGWGGVSLYPAETFILGEDSVGAGLMTTPGVDTFGH